VADVNVLGMSPYAAHDHPDTRCVRTDGELALDLILWRHADAVDADNPLVDLERTLTARSERQAARVADWLARQMPSSAKVLDSPARRAQQTADALGRKSMSGRPSSGARAAG
jgi:broad specificity phosphatase PhoE